MDSQVFSFLFTWTPYLLQGFMWNILITLIAAALGTSIGCLLARVRVSKSPKGAAVAKFASKFFRSVPTLAFMFYAAFVLPNLITIPGTELTITIPFWFKAALGMSGAIIGFTSDGLTAAHGAWTKGDYGAALIFIPSFANSFMISFVASSTASLVGVSEIVSRCNSLIAATGTNVLVPLYFYCSLYFVGTCLIWIYCIKRFKESDFILLLPAKLAKLRVSPAV